MSQQRLLLAAGLADRHQPLEETAMFVSPKMKYKDSERTKLLFEIPRYVGVSIVN
jgi:hypothetical protein